MQKKYYLLVSVFVGLVITIIITRKHQMAQASACTGK